VPRGTVALASPGGRAADAPPQHRAGAAATGNAQANMLKAAMLLPLPDKCPLAWARAHLGAEEANEVEVINIAEILRWNAADAISWNKKVQGVHVVWGWQCPLRLAPAYAAWAEPGATELLSRRCCRPSFAVLPPGVRTAAEACQLAAAAACSVPQKPGGANVLVSVCMRPALANGVDCATGAVRMPPYAHAHATDRTSRNVRRMVVMWEAASACLKTDAAAAFEALARARFAEAWSGGASAKAASVAHGACVPMYLVGAKLAAVTDTPPTNRIELLALAAEQAELSAEMASADTWLACEGGGRARRTLGAQLDGQAPPARQPATLAAFAGLMAAAEGAQ
jgi:hypothetical protein